MIVVAGRNVNDAFAAASRTILERGIQRDSRNGKVLMFPIPVTTLYTAPAERVLFDETRDANPFFHFFEALWMLAGRRDVAFPSHFAKNIASYSDDGSTFNGAYGFRWREWFGRDQLSEIIDILHKNPDDRRCVLQMWDGSKDLANPSKDVPCNTAAYLSVSADGAVDMTVTNRSNDLIWGCYGANAVHFSMLQEYVAGMLHRPVGLYWQMSNNLHVYDKTSSLMLGAAAKSDADNLAEPYNAGLVAPYPMFSPRENSKYWDGDLEMFLDNPVSVAFRHSFFRRVALPMWMAHRAYKWRENPDRFDIAKDIMGQCLATDWKMAVLQWLDRRQSEFVKKQAEKREKK